MWQDPATGRTPALLSSDKCPDVGAAAPDGTDASSCVPDTLPAARPWHSQATDCCPFPTCLIRFGPLCVPGPVPSLCASHPASEHPPPDQLHVHERCSLRAVLTTHSSPHRTRRFWKEGPFLLYPVPLAMSLQTLQPTRLPPLPWCQPSWLLSNTTHRRPTRHTSEAPASRPVAAQAAPEANEKPQDIDKLVHVLEK